MSFRVGQSLWFVPNDRPWDTARAVMITKVGRKWLELDGYHRACRKTLKIAAKKGYDSPGQCWLSRADWEHWCKRFGAWRHLRRQFQDKSHPPENVTLEQIQTAADLLRLVAYA